MEFGFCVLVRGPATVPVFYVLFLAPNALFLYVMESRFNDLEQLFITNILQTHGEYLFDLLVENIEEKDLKKEGDLLGSIRYKVGMDGANPTLSLSFLSYGRAIEINYHKKSSNTKMWASVNTNQLIWGIRKNSPRKVKKNTLWYSKQVYGSLNRLIGRIGSEFTEQTIINLKKTLEDLKQQGVTDITPYLSYES